MTGLDPLARRRARLATSTHPPAWVPDGEGDELVGRVVEIVTREHPDWGPYPIVIVEVDGERLAWHAYGKVAGAQLADAMPRVGARIKVCWVGERTSAAGHPYRCWRVEVERGPRRSSAMTSPAAGGPPVPAGPSRAAMRVEARAAGRAQRRWSP